MKPKLKKIKSAWLITWEWDNDSAALIDKVIILKNSRSGESLISYLIETLYAIHSSNLNELSQYIQSKKNPYKAKPHFNGTITCGNNPFIKARVVKDILIAKSENDFENIIWTEYKSQKVDERGEFITTTEERKDSFTRIISGPLSFLPMWDNLNNRMKTIEEINLGSPIFDD